MEEKSEWVSESIISFFLNSWLAMSCLQKFCCHIGPSELKAVALQRKVLQYEVVPCTHLHQHQQRCHWPERGPRPPGVCCLVPQVPDSQSISTNEGYLIYSDTPGQDWSTLNNLGTLCVILILFCSICLMIESKIGSFIWVLVLFWFMNMTISTFK